MYNLASTGRKQNPHVSVDCVIFGFDGCDLKVLLIERDYQKTGPPDESERDLLLPGDLINDDEHLDEAAARVLKELTRLENIYLEQFHAFGDPERVRKKSDRKWLESIRIEPEARVITVAYYSLVRPDAYQPSASSFARKADWHPVYKLPELGFDHNEIVNKALETLRRKLVTHPVGFELLPQKFTLSQLQKLYEAILGRPLDKRNFRRKIMGKGFVTALSEKQTDVPHKRAQLFSFDEEFYQRLQHSVIEPF
jgi:8-oxo-dGTP diphosphatase